MLYEKPGGLQGTGLEKQELLRVRGSVWAIVVLCYLACVYAFYPGWMTPDSLAQYAQA